MKRTSSKLRKFLSLYDEIQKGEADKPILRFNMPYVGVYWIADQFFCEKQVEISMKMGELETEKTEKGKKFHEEISLGMEKATIEQVWNEILSGRNICVSNLPLIAKWKGIPIIGRADLLYFSESKPLWLFEFKFTSMRIPPDSSHVQARLYSLLLKLMGLDISILKYAIVLAKYKPKNFQKWRKTLINRVKHHKMLKEKQYQQRTHQNAKHANTMLTAILNSLPNKSKTSVSSIFLKNSRLDTPLSISPCDIFNFAIFESINFQCASWSPIPASIT